jgi:hypothetical protein
VRSFAGEWVESPSLGGSAEGTGPAFEMKFLLSEPTARAIESHLGGRLPLDPHGDPALGGAYRTTTLYLDTAMLDVFHRSPSFRKRKHRLRRYGDAPHIFLERKTREGDRVRKLRTAAPETELALLAEPTPGPDRPGAWFHRALLERGLRPVCLVVYERTAYAGLTSEGPLRLTFDRGLRGTPARDWEVLPCAGREFLGGSVILEFKFRAALPALFKELVQEFRLCPTAVSKYRRCMQEWGVREVGRA